MRCFTGTWHWVSVQVLPALRMSLQGCENGRNRGDSTLGSKELTVE